MFAEGLNGVVDKLICSSVIFAKILHEEGSVKTVMEESCHHCLLFSGRYV